MNVEELCTKFTADLSDFRKKMETFTDDLKRASGVTDELRKEISNAMNSSCDKVRKFGKEMSSLVDKQVKTAEAVVATKTKFEKYKDILASVQEKSRKQREEMQKLIKEYHKFTAVQDKQKKYFENNGGLEAVRKDHQEMIDYIHNLTSKYDELNERFHNSKLTQGNEYPQMVKLRNQIDANREILRRFNEELLNLQIDPEKLNTDHYSLIAKDMEELRSKIGNLKHSEMELSAQEEDLNTVMAGTAVKLENLEKKAAAGADSLNSMRSRLNSANKEFQKSNSRFSKFSSTVGKATKGVLSFAWSALGKLKDKLTGTGKSATGLSGKLLKVTKSIKRIGVVALGLKLVKSIFGRLRSVVSNYLSSNEKLNSKVEALKNSLGNALAPAIHLIISLFEKLMPYIVSAANAISDLISSIGIGTALKSTADDVDGVTDSTKKLSKAQKDLYGFDQITKVSDSDDSSDSISASQKLTDYLQKLKDLWNSSDFEGVGSAIAGSLNKVISKINALDWDGIQNKVNKTVEGLTRSLNGFIRDFDWEGSAEILGKGINTVIGAINTFAINFDAKEFGEKLADFLVKGIETIDWKNVGDTIHNLITKLCQAIASFFDELSEDDKGYKAIKQAITDFISGLKLGDIVLNIIKVIVSIGNFTFNFAGNLFDDLWNWLLGKLGVEKDGVGTILLKTKLKIVFTSLLTGGLGAISNLANLVSLLFGKDNVDEKGEVKLTANIEAKGKISESFTKVKEWWDSLKEKKTSTIQTKFEGDNKLSWWERLKQQFGNTSPITMSIANGTGASTVKTELNGKTTSAFDKVKEKWDSIKESGKSAVATITGTVQNTFSSLKTKWDSITNKTNKKTITGSVKSAFTNAKKKWDAIKDKTNKKKITGSVQSAFNTVKSKWDEIKDKAVTVTANAKDEATEALKGIVNKFIGFMNDAIDKINSKLRVNLNNSVTGWLSKIFGLNTSAGSYQIFSIPSIPYLETGGIISKPTVAMVGEHGKEAVMPLENNTGWIKQLAYSIASIMGGASNTSNQGPIIIPIYIGGKHITDVVIDDVNKRTKATGNCPIKI